MVKILRSVLVIALIAGSLSACTAEEECTKKYGANNLSVVAACRQGADQVSAAVIKNNHDQLPSVDVTDGLCEHDCRAKYNLDSVPVSNDPHYFDEFGSLADQINACKTACTTMIAYKRQVELNDSMHEGCMEVQGPGGMTRCYE